MKVMYSVVLLLAALTLSHGYPAGKNDEKTVPLNTEIDFVPLEAQQPGYQFPPGGVVDVDSGSFFGNPFIGNPFPSFLSSIEGLMASIRNRLNQIIGRLPEKAGDSPFPELHIPDLGDVDLGKGNTTSVTKIIDGHKVTINETEYKKDGDNGAAFFKVRIIDVHPDSEEASTEVASSSAQGERESVEETNEIPKDKENEEFGYSNLETFDEVDTAPHKFTNSRRNVDWNNLRSIETIEDNSIDAAPQPLRDLSNDIYVNQLLAGAGAPTNPDAEVFEVFSGIAPAEYAHEVKHSNIVTYPNTMQPNLVNDLEKPEIQPIFNLPHPTLSINSQRFELPIANMMPLPNQQHMAQPPHFPFFPPNQIHFPLQQPYWDPQNIFFTNQIPQQPMSAASVRHPNDILRENGKHKTTQRTEKRELTSNTQAPNDEPKVSEVSIPST